MGHEPGHPEIEGSVVWEAEEKRVRVSLKQAQKAEGGIPTAFKIPLRVECRVGGGRYVGETFEMENQEQTFYLAVPEKPIYVVIDPEQAVLATWKVDTPREWLEAILLGRAREARVYPRLLAVRRMGDKPTFKDETSLGRTCLEDPFWGVQAEAALALGKIRTPHSEQLLLKALQVKHPKARIAVVRALGGFRSPEAAAALRRIVEKGDASWFVEASGALALGRTEQPGIVKVLREAMKKPSWHDVVSTHAVLGLAATRDESVVDDILAIASDRRLYWNCRLTAMRALADLGSARPVVAPRIAEQLARFLDDPSILVSSRAASAIVALGHDSGVAALRRAASASSDPRQAHSYLMAADELAAQRRRGEDVDKLRDEMEKLRSETKEMKETLQKLERKVSPPKKSRPVKQKVSGRGPARKLAKKKAHRGRKKG